MAHISEQRPVARLHMHCVHSSSRWHCWPAVAGVYAVATQPAEQVVPPVAEQEQRLVHWESREQARPAVCRSHVVFHMRVQESERWWHLHM